MKLRGRGVGHLCITGKCRLISPMIKLSNSHFSAFGTISNPHLLIKRAWEHWRRTAGPNWSTFTFDYDIVAPQVKDGRSVAVSRPHSDGVGQTTYKVNFASPGPAFLIITSHALACTCDNPIIIIVSGKHRASTSQGLCPDH